MKFYGNISLTSAVGKIQNLNVETVSSLPTFASAESGRIVYLTSDNELYLNNGSIWKSFSLTVNTANFVAKAGDTMTGALSAPSVSSVLFKINEASGNLNKYAYWDDTGGQARLRVINDTAGTTKAFSFFESGDAQFPGKLLIPSNTSDTGAAVTLGNVNTLLANLVSSAPSTLDTLNELAAALGNDPNFATTISSQIGGKVAKAGDTMTGALNGTNINLTGSLTANSTITGSTLSINGDTGSATGNYGTINTNSGGYLNINSASSGNTSNLKFYSASGVVNVDKSFTPSAAGDLVQKHALDSAISATTTSLQNQINTGLTNVCKIVITPFTGSSKTVTHTFINKYVTWAVYDSTDNAIFPNSVAVATGSVTFDFGVSITGTIVITGY